MQLISFLALLAALPASPVGAQSTMPLADAWQNGGPNAQVGQRPLGPNARAAQRPAGPNAAIARTSKLTKEPAYFPSCAAVGAVRATPVKRGEQGYGRHLDRDGNGVACE